MRLSVAGHESSLVVPFTLELSTGRIARARRASRCGRRASGSRPSASSWARCGSRTQLHVKLDLVAVQANRSASSKTERPLGRREHRRRPIAERRGHGPDGIDAGTRPGAPAPPRRRRRRTRASAGAAAQDRRSPMSIESLVHETCGRAASGSSRPTNPNSSQYCLASSRSGAGSAISRKYPHSERPRALTGLNVRASISRMRWPDGSSQPISLNTSLPRLRYSKITPRLSRAPSWCRTSALTNVSAGDAAAACWCRPRCRRPSVTTA